MSVCVGRRMTRTNELFLLLRWCVVLVCLFADNRKKKSDTPFSFLLSYLCCCFIIKGHQETVSLSFLTLSTSLFVVRAFPLTLIHSHNHFTWFPILLKVPSFSPSLTSTLDRIHTYLHTPTDTPTLAQTNLSLSLSLHSLHIFTPLPPELLKYFSYKKAMIDTSSLETADVDHASLYSNGAQKEEIAIEQLNNNPSQSTLDVSKAEKAEKTSSKVESGGKILDYPEGGFGWLVVLASFVVNFWTFGPNIVWGVHQEYHLKAETFPGVDAAQLSWVGSIGTAAMFISGPFVAPMTRFLGLRAVVAIGILVCSAGLIAASFATELWHLYLSQVSELSLVISTLFKFTEEWVCDSFGRNIKKNSADAHVLTFLRSHPRRDSCLAQVEVSCLVHSSFFLHHRSPRAVVLQPWMMPLKGWRLFIFFNLRKCLSIF